MHASATTAGRRGRQYGLQWPAHSLAALTVVQRKHPRIIRHVPSTVSFFNNSYMCQRKSCDHKMTSTTPLSNPTALLQGIRSLVAFLAEAQICETWADVRAAESANVDCAIHIDPSQLTGNSTERLMSLLGSSGRAETIIPVDVKTATPIACHDHAYWKIALQRIQLRHCEVVIVVFPKEPDCVVVLPVHYLRKKTGSNLDGLESRQFYTHGFRPLWMLHPLPPIPPELTPCVVPVSGLERALADIRRCGKDSTQW